MKSISQTKGGNWIALGVGLALSVLFLVFSSTIYEAMYYQAEFSNEMYNQKLYFVVGLLAVFISWGSTALYYLIIDSFSSIKSWLVLGLINLLLSPTVTWLYTGNSFEEHNFDFSAQIQNFSIVSMAVCLVLFIIASFSLKGLSINSETTPF